MSEEPTKHKILTAARQLFVEHGFAGTSMGKIAKLAGVNHSLLFHYFGNKENLWLAVKQSIARDADQKSKMLPDTHLSFKEFLRELIIKSIRFYRDNPDIIRMINWQRLEYDPELKIGVTVSTEVQQWIEAIKYYQKKGDINSKLKPEFIMTLILSIVSSAALDQNVFISNEQNQKNYIAFCVESLIKALSQQKM